MTARRPGSDAQALNKPNGTGNAISDFGPTCRSKGTGPRLAYDARLLSRSTADRVAGVAPAILGQAEVAYRQERGLPTLRATAAHGGNGRQHGSA